MNKKAVIRRKWSFEKGRNSSAVIFAALVTFIVLVVLFGLFSYEYTFRGNKEQKGVMVRIDPKQNPELFELIDRRDPSRTFGVTGGSFSELYGGKQYDVTLTYDVPELTVTEETVKNGNTKLQIEPVPVSSSYFPVLPSDGNTGRKSRSPATRVVASDGKVIHIPALARLKGVHGVSSTVKISGTEFLKQAETIISCGSRNIDKRAEVILKNSDLPSGIYQINWFNGANGK